MGGKLRLKPGQRVYVVQLGEGGVPVIRAGRVAVRGGKRKYRRAEFGSFALPLDMVGATPREAIALELTSLAGLFVTPPGGPPKPWADPWVMARHVVRLLRLKAQLERHHLLG
jgi:hypothetical protein